MSEIRFNCVVCARSVKCRAEHAGKRAKCPKCQSLITVPLLAESSGDVPAVVASNDNTDALNRLIALRRILETVKCGSIGPGDIHPGLAMNIDQAIAALRTGMDPAGEMISPRQVGEGLLKLKQYVDIPEWYTVAFATMAQGGEAVLRNVVAELGHVAQHLCVVGSIPVETRATQEVIVPEAASANMPSPAERELYLRTLEALKAICKKQVESRAQYFAAIMGMVGEAQPGRTSGQAALLQGEQELATANLAMRAGLAALGPGFLSVHLDAIDYLKGKEDEFSKRVTIALIDVVANIQPLQKDSVPRLASILSSDVGALRSSAFEAIVAVAGRSAANCEVEKVLLRLAEDSAENCKLMLAILVLTTSPNCQLPLQARTLVSLSELGNPELIRGIAAYCLEHAMPKEMSLTIASCVTRLLQNGPKEHLMDGCRLLGRFGSSAAPAIPMLCSWCREGNDQLKVTAIDALGHIGGDAAVATLKELATKTSKLAFLRIESLAFCYSRPVRQRAMHALARLSERHVCDV